MWKEYIFAFLNFIIVVQPKTDKKETELHDFYSHSLKDIHGNLVSLEKYRGMVTLVVNVASECGFTDGHYKGLVRLQKLFSPTNKFTVLGFPCNQFGNQEPWTEPQILKFTQDRYHLNFPLFSKIDVREDEEAEVDLAWQYIAENGQSPNWNFWKYLVDPDGKLISYFGPWSDIEEVTPHVRKAVDEALNAKGPRRPPGSNQSQKDSQDGSPGTQFPPGKKQNAVDMPQTLQHEDL